MPVSSNIISPSTTPPSSQESSSGGGFFLHDVSSSTHNYESILTATNDTPNFTAYRPRLIYSALFTWNTITCGKFIAPFLEDIAPSLFTDVGVVGMTLGLQYAIVAVFAGWGGRLADGEERRCLLRYHHRHHQLSQQSSAGNNDENYNNDDNNGGGGGCWGVGRLKVLSFSILLGTCAILGHAVPSLYAQYYTTTANNNNPTTQAESEAVQFPYELAWQLAMRSVYALSLAIMAPCVDGLALAHLDCIDGASQADFGKERMYGAAFWGMGSLCAGIGIDRYGFEFLYVMTILAALASYVAIGVYWIGLRWDTTGAFVTVNNDVTAALPQSSSLSSSSALLTAVGEEEWNGNNDYMDAEQEQQQRQQQEKATSSSRNTSSNETKTETQDENNSCNKSNTTTSSMQLFRLIFQTGYGKALLFFVFSLAVGISIVDNLAFIFFDSLGSSNTMNGLTVVFTVLFEVPVFYLAPRFLQNHGPGKLLLAAGIAYIVRVIGYTVAPHMSVVLLLETLHGISYAGGKAGSVEYISQIVPKGYEATGQGLLIFVNYMGVVAGLFAGGHIQETLGPRAMFYVMATIVALGTAVLFAAEICLDAPNKRDNGKDENGSNNNADERTNLIKSESACSSGSYADRATESFMKKNLKYDSLNKYVKDW